MNRNTYFHSYMLKVHQRDHDRFTERLLIIGAITAIFGIGFFIMLASIFMVKNVNKHQWDMPITWDDEVYKHMLWEDK